MSLPAFLGLLLCALASGCAFSVDDPETAAAASGGARETVTVRGVCAVAGAVPSELAGGAQTADGVSGARTAIPAFDSGVAITVTFTKGGESKIATATWDAATRSGSYTISLEAGTWTARAAAKTSGATFMSSDPQTVTVVTSGEVAADFVLSVDSSGSGDGEASFAFNCGPSVQSGTCEIKPLSGGGSGGTETLDSATLSGGTLACMLAAGAYRATFTFYDASGQVCYWFAEVVNIFGGLTTDTWVSGGEYIKNNKITVTDAMVNSFMATTFYVDGSSGDDADNGSYFAPVKTVGKAVEKCSRTDGTAYTVYVAGTTAEAATINIPSGADVTITQWAGKTTAKITPASDFGTAFFRVSGKFAMEGITLDGGGGTRMAVSVSAGSECSLSACTFQDFDYRALYISLDASVTATGCGFTDCSVSGGGGGAIYNVGTLSVQGGSFTLCSASGNGGAIYSNGDLTIRDASFTLCSVSGGDGGAICVNLSSATLEGVTVSGCKAPSGNGGAVCWMNGGSGSSLRATDVSIEGCSALGYEGGGAFCIYDSHQGAFSMTGGSIQNCTATNAAAIYYYSSCTDADAFTLSGIDISGCTATDSTGIYGELVYYNGAGGATIGGNSTITCAATSTGSWPMILKSGSGTLTVENGSVLDGNGRRRDDDKPIVSVQWGTFTLAGTVRNAKADSSACGVVVETGTFIMEDGGLITDCESTINYNLGLAVEVKSGATFRMEGGTITGNKTAEGAGVLVNGTFTMTGGMITQNSASGCDHDYGGGVAVRDGGTFNWNGGNIGNNSAATGSDVHVETGATLNVRKDTLQANAHGSINIESGATATQPDGTAISPGIYSF